MLLTPQIIDQTLFDLFAGLGTPANSPIPMDVLERRWAETGLRRSDLLHALQRMEDNGLSTAELQTDRVLVLLTPVGRQRVLGYAGAPGALSVMILRWRRERFMRRRRSGGRRPDRAGEKVPDRYERMSQAL